MTNLDFIILFKRKVDLVRGELLIDFALDICERLLPGYTSFAENHNWGYLDLLKECTDFAVSVKGKKINYSDIKFYLDKLSINIPNMDDFGDFDSSYALNASCAVSECLSIYQIKIKVIFLISILI